MNNRLMTLFMFFGYIIKIILIIIPIILIVLGSIDLLKYMINQDKSNIKLFTKRLIYGISSIFISIIVIFVFNLIGNNINNSYYSCFNNPNICKDVISSNKNKIENNCSISKNKNKCCRILTNNFKATYNQTKNDCIIPVSSLIN